MTTVTSAEIANFRSELADYPEALKALDVLEECEGDLEYAAETIAIESGELRDDLGNKDPNESSWLEKLMEKLRPHLCTQAFKEALTHGFGSAITLLTPVVGTPALLILVIIFISRKNLDEFCDKDC